MVWLANVIEFDDSVTVLHVSTANEGTIACVILQFFKFSYEPAVIIVSLEVIKLTERH